METSCIPLHDKNLSVCKFHPGKIINEVIHLVMLIHMKSGTVGVVKFFLVQHLSVDLFLFAVFTHYLQENGAIAMEDLIRVFHHQGGCPAQFDMVFIFVEITLDPYIS